MEHNIYMHDFDCFPFMSNIVQSKLTEALQHLRRLEVCKSHPELFSTYRLDEITNIHEEQSDFITVVYKQCAVWRSQTAHVGQLNKIKSLEDLTKRLETTTYHILFLIEHIQKWKNRSLNEESVDTLSE